MRYVKRTPTLQEAVKLASEGFVQPITPGLEKDVFEHLEGTDFCVCIYDGETLVGCMLCTIPLPRVLYISGTLVLTDYQGCGIKAASTRAIFSWHPELKWFAGRTQSSIVWSSVRRIAHAVLPNPEEDSYPEMARIRDRVAKELGMNEVIERAFYGGPLYGEKPVNHATRVQDWWDSFCSYERGDAVLYIASLPSTH